MDGLSTKSGVPVNEGKQQLLETKALASELRGEAQEHKKLGLIKGSHDLMEKIDEILEEIEEQSDKLMTTIQLSTTVFHNLQSLHASMLSVKDLFAEINKKSLFLSKRSLKTKMQNLYQTLRSKCTQLMTSVSLVLLTNRPVEEKPVIKLNSELYTLGIHYFYGLNGKPKNYTRAFEKFIQGAEYGDSDAMCMVSKCYLNGYGIEAHYDAGLEWLVKAINIGHSNYAKNELAMLIVERLKEKNENVLRDYFVNRDHIDYETAQNTPNVRNSNVRQSFNTKSKKLLRDVSNNSDLDDIDTDNGLLSSAFYERNNNNDEAKSVTDTQSNYGANALEVEEEVYDLDYAFKLLLEAATEEPAVESAKTNLGMFFEECGDIEQAAKWYSLASNGGCSKATCKLGMLFLNNGTVNANTMTNNRHKSYSMFKMSAMNGETDSFNGLGQCYETGIGCEIDLHTSLKWYLKGAHAGDKLAMYNYGYIKIKNALDVIDTMKKVKKHSKTYLFSHLHKQHEAHHIDDINDSQRNDTHYNPNAEEEGEYIIMGRRADESLQEGLHWLRAASENGVADAAFQIGRLYEQALGVPQDSTAALANYQHAAFLGHSQAALFAANLLYEQFKDNIHDDIVSIMDLYKQAALGGSPEAMNCLGILIEDGHRGLFDNTTYVRSEYAQVTDFYTACMWYYESCLHGLAGAFLNFAMLIATEEIYSFTTLNGTLLTLAEAKKFIENKMAIGILNDNEKANRMGHLLLHMETMQQYAHNNNNVYNSSNKHNSTLVQHNNQTIHHNNLNINSSINSNNNINLSRNNSNSNISGINVPINLTLRAPNYNATNSNNGSVQGSPHRKINNSTTITNQFNHNFALHNSLSTFQNVGHNQNRPHFAPKNDEFASLVLKTMPHSPSKAGNRYNTSNNPNYNSIDSVATTHNNTNNGNHLSVPKLNNSPKAHSNTNNVNSSWGQVDLKQINAFNKSPHTNTAGYNTHYQENFPVNFPANNKQNGNNSQSEKQTNSNKPPLLTSKSYNGPAAHINNNNNNSGNNSNTNQFTYAHNNNSNHNNNSIKNSYDHGTYRSGELYTTNGPIPPPNYVPKAAPVAAPSADTKARPQHANMLGGISSLGGNNSGISSGNNINNNSNYNNNSNSSRLNISTNDAVGSEVDGLHTPTLSNHNNNTNFAGFNAQQNLNNSTLGHYNNNQNRDNGNNSNTSNNSNLNSNNNSSNNSVHSVHFSSDINNTQNNTNNNAHINNNNNTNIHRNNSFNGSPQLGSALASQKEPSAPGNSRSSTPTLINPANNNNSSNNNSTNANAANPSVGGVANTAVAKNRFMSFGSKKHKDDSSTAATAAANTNNNSNNNSRNNSTDHNALSAPAADDKTAHKPSMWKMGFGKSKSNKDNTTNNSTTGIASLDNSPHDTAGSNSPHTTVMQK